MWYADTFNIKSLVKQGTVIGPLLCSTTIAGFCEEHGAGGAVIEDTTIRSLAFVDDIVNTNSNVSDILLSHERINLFPKKKNLPLSTTMCFYTWHKLQFCTGFRGKWKANGKGEGSKVS